jgi:hypothetical protein
MPDGCNHVPPANLPGYEVGSFTTGPCSTPKLCKISPRCDSFHIFAVRNFHLYETEVTVDAESMAGCIEVCNEAEDATKPTQWRMAGKIPAAPFRPPKGSPPYGNRRLSTGIHTEQAEGETQDFISVDYSIDSPVNGLMVGTRFNVPVDIS